ncbi:MAG: sigma 54-interacting transcriptional regulator [Deltaproteobacteria bacterium]|nr:sigma 54-interacting transcriptional regulator [Deltaproteobacteria bacterium]
MFEGEATKRVTGDRKGIRIWSVELTVVAGPSRGAKLALERGVAKIGSAPGNDLHVQDRTVSRVHCEVRVRADGVSVRDLGSTNGTMIDGVRLRDADVPAGSNLRLGETVIRVDVGDEPTVLEVSDRSAFGELVGVSLKMRRLYAILERVAAADATVLILGETGTGKDVVARSIHAASPRASGPFVTVDCGAIPENLIESELFGHARGAFSGAIADRKGVFEEAHGGTLFLDEIGEMPMSMQPKLLRAIERRAVRRVGTNVERPVDVRIVAATNRSLANSVNDGEFREDLYYRLAVVEAHLPPLRARREDIPLLAQHFHQRIKGRAAQLPPEFVSMLLSRGWQGNVRELRNFIERSVSLGWIESARSPSIPPPSAGGTVEQLVPLDLPLKDARSAWMESFESVYVRAMLKKTGGNVTHAAERSGVSRRFLQRLIARLGIKPGEVGARPEDFEGDE